MNAKCWLYALIYAILYRGLNIHRFWYLWGAPGTNAPLIMWDNFWGSQKLYTGFLLCGVASAPLNPMLVKCQLYFYSFYLYEGFWLQPEEFTVLWFGFKKLCPLTSTGFTAQPPFHRVLISIISSPVSPNCHLKPSQLHPWSLPLPWPHFS